MRQVIDSWLPPDNQSPIGLVLSGGGARGAFQVGVWKVLRTDPRGLGASPDVISGTSAGALNGALIAAGLTPEQMLEFWLDLARKPPVVANEKFFSSLRSAIASVVVREPLRRIGDRARDVRILGGLLGKHRWYSQSGQLAMLIEFFLTARFDTLSAVLDSIATPYLFDTSAVKKRLAAVIGGNELRRSAVRLAINAVDVRTGNVVRIVNYRPTKSARASVKHYRYEPAITVDMIAASAAIPLLFNPVKIGQHVLWDGGLLVNSPMAPAVALGARRIIPVLVTKKGHHASSSLPTFGAAVERLVDTLLENAYNIDRKLLLDRNELAGRIKDEPLRVVELFQAIRPEPTALFNAGSYLYFEERALLAMYEAGKRAANDWLSRGPVVDTRETDD